MFRSILIVGLRGAIGAALRYIINILTYKFQFSEIPIATFLVNIIGCFLAGLFLNLIEKNIQLSDDLRLLLITGFCGGLTTFSALTIEEYSFISNKQFLLASVYLGVTVTLGLVAFWLGSLWFKS